MKVIRIKNEFIVIDLVHPDPTEVGSCGRNMTHSKIIVRHHVLAHGRHQGTKKHTLG